jgi:hypothetical protein
MMARFSAIVRVGSMRWPSGVVTGPAVALTHWGLVTLAVRRRMFHPPRMLHAAATTAALYASNACPLKARRVPGSRQVSAASVRGAYRSGRCRHPRPNGCTIGVILVQTVCHPSRRWQRDSSTRASKKSTSWTTLLSCPHDAGCATAEQWLEAARTAHGSALPMGALRAISVTAKSQGMSRWR